MPDIRSRKSSLNVPNIELSYTVKKDLYGSFDVLLQWDFDYSVYSDVLEFKVFKANLGIPRLVKSYTIDQTGLERLTRSQNLTAKSNILYNKSLISQNSKVKVENSNTNQHKKNESFSTNLYSFFNISRVKPDLKNKTYRFLDKNVKFGETYTYYVIAVTKKFKETAPSPIFVNIEWPNAPEPPAFFEVSETRTGIALIMGNDQDQFISKFKVWRREDSEKQFVQIATVKNDSERVSFFDNNAQPKKNYIYRVYSEDIFGNISAIGIERKAVYRFNPITTNIEYRPSVWIESKDSNFFEIKILNTNKEKVKFVRLERRDDWRFETKYEIKKYNGEPWPAYFLFEPDGTLQIQDRTVDSSKTYSYKITAFNEKSQPVSYTLTPTLSFSDSFLDRNIQTPEFTNPKMEMFNMNVISDKQNPVGVFFEWKISGDWSHLLIKSEDEKINYRVDNVHNSIILNKFEKGKKYDLIIELYDIVNEKKYELKNLILNI